MQQGRIIIITGSPGTGKSTTFWKRLTRAGKEETMKRDGITILENFCVYKIESAKLRWLL